ncbi:MAG: hypothetical protein GY765_20005 [bacterium]|nr:hypothetical protein [bacterium]
MLADTGKKEAIGKLKGPSANRSILMVVAFVEANLEIFAERVSGSAITNEKGLTQKLCILLNKNAGEKPFWFEKEFMEAPEKGDSPAVDIGVISRLDEGIFIHSKWYADDESFFAMEAKRLDIISKAREREYLVGRWENDRYRDSGGVERFKKGLHGRNLQYGALIGYVQKFDFDYWYGKINLWLDELSAVTGSPDCQWSGEDKLVEIHRTGTTAKFRSTNSGKGGTMELFHLWVNLVE